MELAKHVVALRQAMMDEDAVKIRAALEGIRTCAGGAYPAAAEQAGAASLTAAAEVMAFRLDAEEAMAAAVDARDLTKLYAAVGTPAGRARTIPFFFSVL